MTHRAATVTLGLALLAPVSARATDAPHDSSASPAVSCTSCHTLHQAVGGAITSVAGNANLCQSCHISRGPAFGFPWVTGDQAVPGVSGHSHRWDAAAVNAGFGAQTPTNAAMSLRVTSGAQIQCSTCHDQHNGATLNGGTQHASVAPNTAIAPVAGGATGTLSLDPPAAGATPKGYLIEIVAGGALGASTFHVSNDNGISWFGWSGAWQAGVAAGRPTGAGVGLNDGVNVTVTFAGTFAAGDRWKLYISYPFLRMANAAGQMCEDCHLSRVQAAAYIESGGDGVKVFSHPVGELLLKGYDRAGALLDANGAVQGSGAADAITTNDLRLDSGGKVRCMSCHYPHNADSNSLTEDAR